MRFLICGFTMLLIALPSVSQDAPDVESNAAPPLVNATLGKTPFVHRSGNLYLSGQPPITAIEQLPDSGIKRVITLRTDGEIRWDESAEVKQAGMEFYKIPLAAPETFTDEALDRARELLRESEKHPTLLHCASANRVGAVWMTFRVLDQGVPIETAIAEAKEAGMRSTANEKIALAYIQNNRGRTMESADAKPGINANFLDPDLKIEEWIQRFEIESREVFQSRKAILAACDIQPGQAVADIGAGTGLYTRMFSEAVGAKGMVYAVDISPKFIEHLDEQVQQAGRTNIKSILCTSESTLLPPASIDVAFVCDTYHHFEHPQQTLASIRRALRPGGKLFVIDFDRIPGKSREWLLTHVRADKATFRKEIESAGFDFLQEKKIDGLQENYFLAFQKNR